MQTSSVLYLSVFSEEQQIKSVGRNCSNITFNIFSTHNSETITDHDGPCGSSALSVRPLDIQFTNCTCPIGFEPSASDTRCECICDSQLSPFIADHDCDPTTESLIRVNRLITSMILTHLAMSFILTALWTTVNFQLKISA